MKREAYMIKNSGIIAFHCSDIGELLVDEFIDWFENRESDSTEETFAGSQVIAGMFEGDEEGDHSLCGYFYTKEGRRFKVDKGIVRSL